MTDSNVELASGFELSTQQKRIVQFAEQSSAASLSVAPILLALRAPEKADGPGLNPASYQAAHAEISSQALQDALLDWAQDHELLFAHLASVKGIKFPLIQLPENQDASPRVTFVEQQLADEAALEAQLHTLASTLCSLIDMPLVTLHCLRVNQGETCLAFLLSPLIADVHSSLHLASGVLARYQQSEGVAGQMHDAQSDDALQYLDVAETFAEMLQEADKRAQSEQALYYRATLLEKDPLTHWYLGQPYKVTDTAGFVSHSLASDAVAHARQWCIKKDVTLRGLFTGLARILLSRLAPNDIALALAVSGRNDPELATLLGPVSRIMPVNLPFEANQTLYSFAAQLDAQIADYEVRVETFDWQEVWRTHTQAFVLDYVAVPSLTFQGIDALSDSSHGHPLKLSLVEHQNGVTLALNYRGDALNGTFDALCAKVFFAKFEQLLAQFLANPDTQIGGLGGQSPLEQHLLQNAQPDAPLQYHTIHDTVAHFGATTPDVIAVWDESGEYSYAFINEQADAFAQVLLSVGFNQPQSPLQAKDISHKRVAICTHRNHHFVIAMLAVLKTGATYVPVDPDFHPRRMQQILDDADCDLVIVQDDLNQSLPKQLIPVFTVSQLMDIASELVDPNIEDSSEARALHRARHHLASNLVPAQQTAYLIYTSGSTGVPKGVCVTHAAITQYVANVMQVIGLQPALQASATQPSLMSLSSLATDLGHTALFGALLTGQTLRLFDAAKATDASALAQALSAHPVDCLKIVPAHLKALLADAANASILPTQCLVLGGDKLGAELIQTVRRLRPDLRIVNHYGPTETCVGVMTYSVPAHVEFKTGQVCPIGQPLGANRVLLLNAQMQPVGVGEVGDIYLGGATLAQGYRQQPAKTAEVFVPYEGGERLYRTGDVGYCLVDGNVMFLARADNQVKIRGHRIELSEIEQAICAHDAVSQAVVRLQKNEDDVNSEGRLVAYLVMEKVTNAKIGQAMTQEVLKNHLTAFFPEYMIPSAFKVLKQIPLTQNGKIDTKALPRIEFNASRSSQFIAPDTALEKELAQQWSALLAIHDIGVKDSFFHLGGHSLLVTQFLSWLKRSKNIELSVKHFFDKPTIAGLAELIQQAQAQNTTGANTSQSQAADARVSVDVAKIRQSRAAHNGQMPLSFGQERLWLIDELDGANSDYNTPHIWLIEGELNSEALNQAWMALVQQQHSLRTYFIQHEGTPVQCLANEAQLKPLQVVDFTGQFSDFDQALAPNSALKQALRQDCACLFPLHQPPLYLFKLYQIDATHQVLLLNMHHIISDGWSFGIIQSQLTQAYNHIVASDADAAAQGILPTLDYQYVDFALWQRDMLRSGAWQQDIDFWDKKLRDVPEIRFPKCHSDLASNVTSGALQFWLDDALQSRLSELYQTQNISPFMLCMAAYQLMLSLYTKQDDFAVGTSIAGRTNAAFDAIVGFFVNQLAFRVDTSGSPSVSEFLARVKQSAIEAYAHQDVPFSVLVSKLKGDRNTERTPFFQCLYVFQEYPATHTDMTGLSLRPYTEFDFGAKFDLTLYMGFGKDGRLGGTLTFNTAYFDNDLANSVAQYFQRVLQQFVDNPDGLISQIDIKTDAEKRDEQEQKSAARKSRFGRVEKRF